MASAGKTRERIMTLVFMLATTLVVVGTVAGAYLATADRIRANATLFLKRAVLQAAGIAFTPGAQGVEQAYGARIRSEGDPAMAYTVLARDGSAAVGHVLLESGAGLWGPVRAAVGFDAAGERLTGIEFIEQVETPGLGARIEEEWFKAQFRGKRGPLTRVPEGAPDTERQFDAITGATITSKAVEDIVNRCVARLTTGERRTP